MTRSQQTGTQTLVDCAGLIIHPCKSNCPGLYTETQLGGASVNIGFALQRHSSIIPPANRISGGKPYASTRMCGQSAQLSERRRRNGSWVLNACGSSGVCG